MIYTIALIVACLGLGLWIGYLLGERAGWESACGVQLSRWEQFEEFCKENPIYPAPSLFRPEGFEKPPPLPGAREGSERSKRGRL